MSKRLLVVTLCILLLPMLASVSYNEKNNGATPAVVAFAGHTVPGNVACACGTPGCYCDPGELPALAASNTSQPDDMTLNSKTPSSEADYGTGALMLALALLVWLRLRA